METCPVTDYITEFEALVPQTKYEGESLVYFFKKGLNTALLDDLLRLDPIPDTLEKWKSRAIERNAAYLERIREMAARKGTSAFAPRTPKAGTSPSQNANRTRTLAPSAIAFVNKGDASAADKWDTSPETAPRIKAREEDAPAVASAPPAPAASTPLAVPPINRAMAALSAQILALDAEQQEEAKAALKDMVKGS
ncbi:hypothetical protein BV25DRAFT_1918623 [Artomyces pyxidatus]|uniref:Uncharacterized protein n=1 Tax=Artomyces pyxidatus TaxID=48021 RepID=A0ACB8STG1_9AGAM|nr:hypothetical protein BV25DRAFT_1918623 [Artomyces pyxidatus]